MQESDKRHLHGRKDRTQQDTRATRWGIICMLDVSNVHRCLPVSRVQKIRGTRKRPLPVAAKDVQASERFLTERKISKHLLDDAGVAESVTKLANGPLHHLVGTGLSEPYLVT